MITHDMGEYRPMFCSASGSRPPMAVAEVSRMGRKRISPACSMASSSGTPCSRSWLVKSTSRMEFLISMPTSATKPIEATKEMSLPESSSMSRPPNTPSGTTVSTMSVDLKLPNSSTRMAKMPKIATMMAMPMPPKASCAGFVLAAQVVVVAARPVHLVELCRDLARELADVVAGLCIRIDGHGAFAIEALDQRRRLLELQRGELRQRQRAAARATGTRTCSSAANSACWVIGERTTIGYCSPVVSL